MNALVVGAGIGGITAAIALARDGHRVTLLEKMGQFAPIGAGIVIAPNAAQVLASLGVDLAAHGRALDALEVTRADGTVLQRLEPAQVARDYGPLWALTRPALHAALLGAFPRDIELVLHSPPIVDLRDAGDGVEVALDGPQRYDFVVGADGLHSGVREGVLGPVPLRYSGVTCWRGLVANPGFSCAIEAWGGATRIGVVPLRDDQLYYYLVMSAPRRAPSLAWPDGFRAAFGQFRGGVEKLFDVLEAAPPLHHDLEELEAPVWGRGRVFLLGDAAHAMTPNQGQGAAMAIEDALALAHVVRPGLDGALERYAALRGPRVRKVQLDSRRLGDLAHWRHPLAQAVRDGGMRLLPAASARARFRAIVEPGLALLRDASHAGATPG